MILSSDAHCGALAADYRPYLVRRWHEEWTKTLEESTSGLHVER